MIVSITKSSPVICSPRPSSAVLARLLQSSLITCRARQSPTGPARHPELPGKLRHVRHLQSPPVRPGLSSGRRSRYPSVPGALSGSAVRPVRTQRRTDWTLGNTVNNSGGETALPNNVAIRSLTSLTCLIRETGQGEFLWRYLCTVSSNAARAAKNKRKELESHIKETKVRMYQIHPIGNCCN